MGLPCNIDRDDTSCSEESDHATRSADPFCFVRYAIKRRPQKPRIIIGQVDGSGAASVEPSNSKAVETRAVPGSKKLLLARIGKQIPPSLT